MRRISIPHGCTVLSVFFFVALARAADVPTEKLISSFEDEKHGWSGGVLVKEHATDGKQSLRIDANWANLSARQDLSGYDYLKIDTYIDAKDPFHIQIGIKDTQSRDYWTRVNYFSVIPPGASTLVIPVQQLYVGEKQFPGRKLLLKEIADIAILVGDKPVAPLYIDNIRLVRDDEPAKAKFEGLIAFDLGPDSGPVMEGFTQLTPSMIYTPARRFGFKDANLWRPFDVLQPDPLYQDCVTIQKGGIAVDVPNGKYRVCTNIDFAGGYWGEVARYRNRRVLAEGKEVLNESMDFEAFKMKRYQSWNVEVLPTVNTFDVFQKRIFKEKVFDVDVQDGQLNVEFEGMDFTCAVSSFIAFPVNKAAEGEKFLKYVENRRRFHFDNNAKRILHRATGDPLSPSAVDKKRGYIAFNREFMRDLYYNDTPFNAELARPFAAHAFAGEIEPLSICLLPLQDLGKVTLSVSDLSGPGGKIPASAISTSYLSYRLLRSNLDGTVYTIAPRALMPMNAVNMPRDIARRFLLTVRTPLEAKPGVYKGTARVQPEKGQPADLPLEFTVHTGTLDPLDVPAGPIGYTADVPWFEDDPAAKAFNQKLNENGLNKMREYGFTLFAGAPVVRYRGFKEGKPDLDFSAADPTMKLAKELGFLAVNSYGGGLVDINAYARDMENMKKAGFNDYSEFVKTVFTEVQKHADAQGWIPVYWCLGDEPAGNALIEAIANAEAYRKAFPKGPPYFTAYSSFAGANAEDHAFKFAKALHLPTWALHDEASVNLLKPHGGEWAFYNVGSPRWIYGDYLYKAAKQFNLKFRATWHWNNVYGDPYYCLDGRAEDFNHLNGSPDGTLILDMIMEHSREGIDDYRRLLTLARLCKEKKGTPAAEAGEKLINERMNSFKIGQCDHEPMFSIEDYDAFRAKTNAAIDALRE